MNHALPNRVLLIQQRQWGVGIGHELAKRFQRDGCKLAALTFKKSTDAFTRRQTDVSYEFIESHDAIVEFGAATGITLEQVCTELGVDSIWPFVMSMRNHVYSYGDKYYFSFMQNRDDEEIIDYVKNLYLSIKRLFDAFEPDFVVVPNFVSMPQAMIGLLAQKRGVPVVSFTDSKVTGVTVPASTPYLDEGPFIDRVRELNAGERSANQQRADEYIAAFRQRFIRPHALADSLAVPRGLARLKQELVPFLQVGRFLLGRDRGNRVKSFGITIDYRPPRIILRDHYQAKRYRRAALAREYADPDRIGPFVYMPLQVQPEAQIDMLATHFANQIETARQVALALPGDYTLAVKEHPAMIERRPPSYHEKLARLPNVKLLDPQLPAPDAINRCALVVNAGGTVLAEAAFYCKPAIQLGRLGTTLMLPNVTRHTDMTTLPSAIRQALDRDDLGSGEYERCLGNYVAAAYDTGFELDFERVWYEGGSAEDYDAIYRLCCREFDRGKAGGKAAEVAFST
jgi:hypothetical protein